MLSFIAPIARALPYLPDHVLGKENSIKKTEEKIRELMKMVREGKHPTIPGLSPPKVSPSPSKIRHTDLKI